MNRSCENCEWKFGYECRRFPPIIRNLDLPNKGGSAFPKVEDYEFCGEFKNKEE